MPRKKTTQKWHLQFSVAWLGGAGQAKQCSAIEID